MTAGDGKARAYEGLWTIPEVAAFLSVAPVTVRKWELDVGLPALLTGETEWVAPMRTSPRAILDSSSIDSDATRATLDRARVGRP